MSADIVKEALEKDKENKVLKEEKQSLLAQIEEMKKSVEKAEKRAEEAEEQTGDGGTEGIDIYDDEQMDQLAKAFAQDPERGREKLPEIMDACEYEPIISSEDEQEMRKSIAALEDAEQNSESILLGINNELRKSNAMQKINMANVSEIMLAMAKELAELKKSISGGVVVAQPAEVEPVNFANASLAGNAVIDDNSGVSSSGMTYEQIAVKIRPNVGMNLLKKAFPDMKGRDRAVLSTEIQEHGFLMGVDRFQPNEKATMINYIESNIDSVVRAIA